VRDEKDGKFQKSLREYRDKKHKHKHSDSVNTVHNNQQHRHLVEENFITHVHRRPTRHGREIRRSRSASRLGDELQARAHDRRTSSLNRMSIRHESEVAAPKTPKTKRSRSKSPRPRSNQSSTSRSDVTERTNARSAQNASTLDIRNKASPKPRKSAYNSNSLLTDPNEKRTRQPSIMVTQDRSSPRPGRSNVDEVRRKSMYYDDRPSPTPPKRKTIDDYYNPRAVFLRISRHPGVTRIQRSGSLMVPAVYIMQKSEYNDEEYDRLRLVTETFNNRETLLEDENKLLLRLFLESEDGIDGRASI
jgi:hypothetical protein